jgi:peptidoglycan/LPS O-acetylase OafA/YrhL
MTLYYLPYFVFGALLARYRMALKEWAATLPRWAGLGLWLLAYVLLKFRWLAPAPSVIFDLANGAGAALVIALVFVSPAAQALLMRRPLTWLGDISYSLYLVHVPVIVVIVRAMPETLPLPAKLMLAPAVSLALATLLFRIVERPSIQLGNLLASRLAGHDLARCGVDFGTAQPGSLAFDHYPADMSEQRWEHNGREVWKRVRFIINPTDAAIHQFGAS